MTKRESQAAEYAAEKREQYRRVGEWFHEQFNEDIERVRALDAVRAVRRDTTAIRVHRAISAWLRYAWLKFLGR